MGTACHLKGCNSAETVVYIDDMANYRKPSPENTATVMMDHHGATLTFAGRWYDDFRSLPEDIEEDAWDEGYVVDAIRARQMLSDVKQLSSRGLAFVIDYENNGTEDPKPVDEYLSDIHEFVSEMLELLDKESRNFVKSVKPAATP